MPTPRVSFFYAPQTRATAALALFEELGVAYDLHMLNLKAGSQRQREYLAVNPMGKVPAIVHDGALVSEQPAVFIYLADLYADKGLAPALDDPLRGPYLRWLVFYGSCFEPAIVDRAMKREPAAMAMSPYGTWEQVLDTLTAQLREGPYLFGERFTAADVLWGTALNWTTRFQLAPELPVIRTYIDRVLSRPAMQRALAKDAEFAAQQA